MDVGDPMPIDAVPTGQIVYPSSEVLTLMGRLEGGQIHEGPVHRLAVHVVQATLEETWSLGAIGGGAHPKAGVMGYRVAQVGQRLELGLEDLSSNLDVLRDSFPDRGLSVLVAGHDELPQQAQTETVHDSPQGQVGGKVEAHVVTGGFVPSRLALPLRLSGIPETLIHIGLVVAVDVKQVFSTRRSGLVWLVARYWVGCR